MSEEERIDEQTRAAEAADAKAAHEASRGPTEEEERLAEASSAEVDEAEVSRHEQEMNELGADVKGEGEIS